MKQDIPFGASFCSINSQWERETRRRETGDNLRGDSVLIPNGNAKHGIDLSAVEAVSFVLIPNGNAKQASSHR